MLSFSIQKDEACSREGVAVHSECVLNKWPVKICNNPFDVLPDSTPCGTVEWCLKVLGKNVEPDYYPSFLSNYLNRKVWRTSEWPVGKCIFIKPSDRYKRFTGFVTNGGYKKKQKGPYWCSDVVHFKNEWRYYISNGVVLTSGWYSGDEIKEPFPPELEIDLPKDYCGALDFGTTTELPGVLTLVEANHPFACGWYGRNNKAYVKWLVDGWKFVKSNIG